MTQSNTSSTITKDTIKAALEFLLDLTEIIRLQGEIPSGVLYSQLCDKLSLNNFYLAINKLEEAKLVTVSNNLIKYIGPKREPAPLFPTP